MGVEQRDIIVWAVFLILGIVLGVITGNINNQEKLDKIDKDLGTCINYGELLKQDLNKCRIDNQNGLNEIDSLKGKLKDKDDIISLYKLQYGDKKGCTEEYLPNGEPRYDYKYGYYYKCITKTCGELDSTYPVLKVKLNNIYEQVGTVLGKGCEDAYYQMAYDKLVCPKNLGGVSKINETINCTVVW